MNFLLHHHLAALDLGSREAAVGAMLPDLWRMADRRVRPARGEPVLAGGELGAVLAGIVHHVTVDRWFHRAPVFRDGEAEAVRALRSVDAPRIGLFAHVLWEMCLDGALVERRGLAAVLADLRAGLRAVCTEAPLARRAVELHHFGRVARSAPDRAAFDRRMERIARELADGPWIDGYQDGAGLALRVDGVRCRLGLAPLDAPAREALASASEGLLSRARAVLDGLLRDGRATPPT